MSFVPLNPKSSSKTTQDAKSMQVVFDESSHDPPLATAQHHHYLSLARARKT
jgi:hypothetical protein